MKSFTAIIMGVLFFLAISCIGSVCVAAGEWTPPIILWLEPELPMTADRPVRLNVEYAINPNLGIEIVDDTGSYTFYFAEIGNPEERFNRETHRVRYQKTNAYYTIMKKYGQAPDSIKDKVSLSYSGDFQVELPDLDTCCFYIIPHVGRGRMPYTSYFVKSGNKVEFYDAKSGAEKLFRSKDTVSTKREAEKTDPNQLTKEHLQLVLGEQTSLTDQALPDGVVLTERWYKGTDNMSFFGYFHVKIVESPDRDDELVAQHDFVVRNREKLIQGRLITTCAKDEYYTMRSFEIAGKRGAGKGRDSFRITAKIEPSDPGDSLPFVLKTDQYIRNLPEGIPENTMMLFFACEKVRELPFDRDVVFTCNSFYPFEFEVANNLTLTYTGPNEFILDDRQFRAHTYSCEGKGMHSFYLLTNDSHQLIGILGEERDDRLEITLISRQEVIDNWDF